MQYYFPSCKFTQMKPETSGKIKAFMEKMGVRVAGCCRPGHKALAGGDTAITICETCSIIVCETRPGTKNLSLYEFIDSLPDFSFPDYKGEKIALQDCYRAKHKEAEKAAIRNVMRKMNIEIVELPGTEEETNFDGKFLFSGISESNLALAPCRFTEIQKDVTVKSPEEAAAWLKEYARRFTAGRVACYCNSCFAGLKEGLPEGKTVVHVAELLFP